MNKRIEPRMDRGSWLIVICIAGAAVVYLTCLLIPQSRSVSATLAQLQDKQSFILESQKSLQAAELAKVQLDKTVEYNAKYGQQLLKPQELSTLFRQISQIAKTDQITMPRFEPHPPLAYDSFQKISVDLSLAGPFAAIHDVISRLEALPARIWIDELQIRAPREPGGSATCDMKLVVFTGNRENND